MSAKVRLLRWSEADRLKLAELLDEVGSDGPLRHTDGPPTYLPHVPDMEERARTLYEQRKARRRSFGEHAAVFQEPAWDIILELFLAHGRSQTLAVTSISYAIGASASTTLRWIGRLEVSGLVESSPDPQDARVRRVGLTALAVEMVHSYLEEV